MKKLIACVGIFAFLMLLTVTVVHAQIAAKRPCCIAGEYKGIHVAIASHTCPKPDRGEFIMTILQAPNCGPKIWGKIVNAKDGSAQEFTGTVMRGAQNCCAIALLIKKAGPPPEETRAKGVLCFKDGKWSGHGTYKNSRGCGGTWEMKQV